MHIICIYLQCICFNLLFILLALLVFMFISWISQTMNNMPAAKLSLLAHVSFEDFRIRARYRYHLQIRQHQNCITGFYDYSYQIYVIVNHMHACAWTTYTNFNLNTKFEARFGWLRNNNFWGSKSPHMLQFNCVSLVICTYSTWQLFILCYDIVIYSLFEYKDASFF